MSKKCAMAFKYNIHHNPSTKDTSLIQRSPISEAHLKQVISSVYEVLTFYTHQLLTSITIIFLHSFNPTTSYTWSNFFQMFKELTLSKIHSPKILCCKKNSKHFLINDHRNLSTRVTPLIQRSPKTWINLFQMYKALTFTKIHIPKILCHKKKIQALSNATVTTILVRE